MTKYVYLFSEGNASMKNLLGGKGAGLAEMTNIGLPVPPGITITTEACTDYYVNGEVISDEILSQIKEYMKKLEDVTGKTFGGNENPLLVSVRSGARVSMPGMMDTILNLGLNDDTVAAIAKLTENERFAYDSYRRFIMMFSDVAIGIDRALFDNELDKIKEEKHYSNDTFLTAEDLKGLVETYKKIFKDNMGYDFPTDPSVQLKIAVEAIFKSWNNPRAITYRKINKIPSDWGTAVNIQSMVYGNMGSDSGTGVAFTRSPSTGENTVYGEYLINAQGEDVVAGVRTPEDISRLKEDMPEIYDEFVNICKILENHYKDMQDMEFTIENGKLYMLQTRTGKRTAQAALHVAVSMVEEGLIDKQTALLRVDADSLSQLMHPTFDSKALADTAPTATGLPASPGAAVGRVYFTADDATKHAKSGEDVILVRRETSPEDIEGMNSAVGILTARGGMTSHAAVVARGMGKCCVAGCSEIAVYEHEKYFTVNGQKVVEGDYISIDGSTGNVYLGQIPTAEAGLTGDFATVMEWADEVRRLGVRANADTPKDTRTALNFGAEGIGLCRTEHMFFEASRILEVRKMICADNTASRKAALENILPMQKQDFVQMFIAMEGKPVTIRLLDPPLHEFLPKTEKEIKEIADQLGITEKRLNDIIVELSEVNPMLGIRGCRLPILYPEIAEMQTKAILYAALDVAEQGIEVDPEIMVPLAGNKNELDYVYDIINATAEEVFKEKGKRIKYTLGTMIEIPRAALISGSLAESADFFSFGTNDLTQMGLGLSRDDTGKLINEYIDKHVYSTDPFQSIDTEGVGRLVSISVEEGRRTKPSLHCGVCGEHGGDPSSIYFFDKVGLDYVSCSPYRVPTARLAAAQAVLINKEQQ